MVGMAYVFGADADVDVGEDESKKGDDGDRAGERSDAKELSEALRSPQRYFARKRGAIGREERKRLLYYLTVARRLEVHFSIMCVNIPSRCNSITFTLTRECHLMIGRKTAPPQPAD
jgi:hypothetical protein